MNIILTESFLKKFRKDFRKYNFGINNLVKKLKNIKLITLKEPCFKVKFNINSLSIRGIVLLNLGDKLLPVFFVLKKDKKYGENLFLSKEIKIILEKLSKEIEKDLINKNYIEY